MVLWSSCKKRGTFAFNVGKLWEGKVGSRLEGFFQDKEFIELFGEMSLTDVENMVKSIFPGLRAGENAVSQDCMKMMHKVLESAKWNKVCRPTIARRPHRTLPTA